MNVIIIVGGLWFGKDIFLSHLGEKVRLFSNEFAPFGFVHDAVEMLDDEERGCFHEDLAVVLKITRNRSSSNVMHILKG